MASQTTLQSRLLDHVRLVQAGLPDAATRGAPAPSSSQRRAELCALVVVRELEPGTFVRGTLGFARAMPRRLRDAWYRTFTKTLFFAGNPAGAAGRIRCDHLSPDQAIGWLWPRERAQVQALRRMLRLLHAPAAAPEAISLPPRVSIAGAGAGGRRWRLTIATARVSTQEYLVHLNHALCEITLRGLVTPADTLVLEHVAGIDPAEEQIGRYPFVRIGEDVDETGRLRVYATLEPWDGGG